MRMVVFFFLFGRGKVMPWWVHKCFRETKMISIQFSGWKTKPQQTNMGNNLNSKAKRLFLKISYQLMCHSHLCLSSHLCCRISALIL